MEQKEKVLRIQIGNETRPIVEKIGKDYREKSFFSEQYDSTFSAIDKYLQNLESTDIATESDNNIW